MSQLPHRLVHLDLKGAPPGPAYLKNLYPLFKKWGVTGLLLEWEDCFPYKNPLNEITNNIYTDDDALQILEDAKEAKLEVIPLVQTFGHLEFVLKHKNYICYREVPLFPSSMCPSHPGTLDVISSMLEQVIEFHVGIKFIHIGADEVWHMGFCELCKSRLNNNETKEDLFLQHIKKVLEMIKLKCPALNIIMWDDMLRGMDEATLRTYNLKSLVEPMIWDYNPAQTFNLPMDLFSKYSYFEHVWTAGAFKGATGSSQLIPIIDHHASNVLQWTSLSDRLKTNFRGIALTGWSRYDHFAAHCELLPPSLQSLGVCLSILEEGTYNPTTLDRVRVDLHFPLNPFTSSSPSRASQGLSNFGHEILFGVTRFVNIRKSANATLSSEQLESWVNEWQVAHGLVNPMQVVSLAPILNNYIIELDELEKHLRAHMSCVYYDRTIAEWMGTHLIPLRRKVQKVAQTVDEEIAKASRIADEVVNPKKCGQVDEMDC